MKNLNLNIRILMVCMAAVLFLPSRSYAQLNGNYTINPTQPASSGNYQTWASAISDLTSQGISGPVKFSVYDTVYNNQSLTIPAISGTSWGNRITFQSMKGDSTKCKLVNPIGKGANGVLDWVMRLNGSDYITFRKIGFERSGTTPNYADSGTVVRILGDADNCHFINCFFKGEKKPSSQSKPSTFTTGIGGCVFYEAGAQDSFQFINNRFLYGYNSIYNALGATGTLVRGNLCDTPGSTGIYLNSQINPRVLNNRIIMGDHGAGSGHYTSYGIRMDNGSGLILAGNNVQSLAVNCQVSRSIVVSFWTGSTNARNYVYNNTLYNIGGTNNCNGLALNTCAFLNVMYNNILVSSSLQDGAALFFYTPGSNANVNVLNNNLINKGAGYAISGENNASTTVDTVDYNNLYSAGTSIALWGAAAPGGKRSDLAAFKSASSKCANCLNMDPGFASSTDLHVSNIGINGKALAHAAVLVDIDNDTRHSTTPDIGSDEFFPVTTDAGVSLIDSPSYFCPGQQAVKVKFQNYGIDPLTKLSIGWSVNGVTQSPLSWTGNVASGVGSASLNLGNYTFVSNTAYDFKIWTSNPNGSPDGKPLNDTLKLRKYPAMTGSYSIGDTVGANYKTFNVALNEIGERGLCGAVVFEVHNGTYGDQLGIATLPRMGKDNPITFKSKWNDSSKVRVSVVAGVNPGSNIAALQLRGCSYVNFKGITFERIGTGTYGQVIHILNNSHHNTFTNCQMIGIQQSTANVSFNNIYSDLGQDDHNVFRNNYIKWGSNSVLFTNTSASVRETGNAFEGNLIEGGYINAIQLNYVDGAVVKGNTFLNGIAATNSDILLTDCDSNINVSGNYSKSTNTSAFMVIRASQASPGNPGYVANNHIVRSTGTGIVLDTTANIHVVYNSINFTGSGSNYGISTTGNSTNLDILNNNIVMADGEAFNIIYGSEIGKSDYNNILTKGVGFAYVGGIFGNLADLQAGTGTNANSLSINPFFKSNTDLHIKNPLMKGAGTPVKGVTIDIDGETRNSTTPDIGADEFKLEPNDGGIVELVNPVAGTCAGTLPIEIVIRNFGNDTLKTATIYWSAANKPQTPYSWTGKLATGQMDTFIIGSYNFIGSLNPKFIFVNTLPNGLPDGIEFNDSLVTNRSLRNLPNVNAGPDRSVCLGDTLNIGPNSAPGITYKWLTFSGITLGTNSKLNVKPGVPTSYILEGTSTSFGCQKRDTLTVNVNPSPTVNAGGDKNICPGSSTKIGSTTQSGFTYSWESLPSGFTSSISDPTVTPTSNADYVVTMTNSTTGCKDSDTVSVKMAPVPNADVKGPSVACFNDAQFFYTTGLIGNNFTWTLNGGTILNKDTSTLDVRWTTLGVGTVRVVETNSFNCSDTSEVSVTVAPNPVAKFGASPVCLGSPTNFLDSSGTVQTYSWEFGDGGTSNIKDPVHTYLTVNTFTTTLIVKTGNCSDTTSKQVKTNALPLPDFTYSRNPGRMYDFNDISTVPGGGTIVSWIWDFGDGDSAFIKRPTNHYPVGSFTIKLCVTASNGCQSCKTQSLNVVGINDLDFDNNLFVMPNPGSGLFTVTSSVLMNEIVVTNAMGQVIQTILPGESQALVDLTSYTSGVYFIRVNMDGQHKVLKLVKQ